VVTVSNDAKPELDEEEQNVEIIVDDAANF
jgi:hypothetical protein